MSARVFSAVPVTLTCLSGASTSLFSAATVTVPVLAVSPAATVSIVPVCVKSPATAGDTADADTMTVVSASDGCDSVAVTRVTPPFSEIDVGASTSVTAGTSSSRVVTGTSSFASPL